MVAGDKEKHLKKIDELLCDVVMINLEDGVFDKQYALELILNHFPDGFLDTNKEVVIRVNSLQNGGIDEIKTLNKLKPKGFRIPKIESLDDVRLALSIVDLDIEVHLSIETKEAFLNLVNFGFDRRVTTVYLGILDLFESLDLPQNLINFENPMVDYILSKFLVDSKIGRLKPIFFTFQDYQNLDDFRLWLLKGKSIGYCATSCISPAQVLVANEIFAKDENEYKKAKYIVEVFNKNRANKITGFVDEKYGFIDEPIFKNAQKILENH